MKNKTNKSILILVVIFSTNLAFSQSFKTNNNYLSLGYGIGWTYKAVMKIYESEANYKSSSFGPIVMNYERAINDHFGIGFNISNASNSFQWEDNVFNGISYENYKYKIKLSTFQFLGKGYYHFTSKNEKLDPYVSLGMGYRKYSWKMESSDATWNYNLSFGGPFGYSLLLGTRYMINKNVGLYAEAGFGTAAISGGIVTKF